MATFSRDVPLDQPIYTRAGVANWQKVHGVPLAVPTLYGKGADRDLKPVVRPLPKLEEPEGPMPRSEARYDGVPSREPLSTTTISYSPAGVNRRTLSIASRV